MDALNERIKSLRKEKGLTQSQLAEQLNVTDKAVSKWEVGEANPDITLLAKMAQIFGVTVDYLLTGVAPEEKIVIKSPKEMLFETDDPKYLDNISENDLDVVQMYEHKLARTFSYLVDNNKIRGYLRGKRGRHGNANDYIPEILYMLLVSNRLDKIKIFDFNDIGFADENELSEDFLNAFVSDERVTDETREYVLSIHCRKLISVNQGDANNNENNHRYGNWQMLYPKLLDRFAKAKNWTWVKKILDIALAIDEPMAKMHKEAKNNPYDSQRYTFAEKAPTYSDLMYGGYRGLQVFGVPSDTLHTLLDEQQYDLLDLANRINEMIGKGVISKKTIDMAKLDSNSSLSDEEKFEKKCVYNHIINMNVLGGCRDLKLIRKILDTNYYHYYEYMHALVNAGKTKEAYEFLVDNDFADLASKLFFGKDDNYADFLRGAYNAFTTSGNGSKEHKALIENQNKIGLENGPDERYASQRGRTFRSEFVREHGEPEEIASNIGNNAVIQRIKELKENAYNSVVAILEAEKVRKQEQKEREKIAKGLTKDYFEKLLNSGTPENIKLFKLELCSLLDAIFMYDYHYGGEDFSERMNSHFKSLEEALPQERTMDDGWGYQVADTQYTEEVVIPERNRVAHLRDIFYRLRVLRNNILHPEKVKVEELSDKELKECLEYVFSINKKVEE